MKYICKLILKLIGWKFEGEVHKGLDKYVLIMAPHTSNYDFIIGRIIFSVIGLKVSFLIKKEFFFFPVGIILKALGAMPINRKFSANAISHVTKIFDENEKFILVVTPEGTRSFTKTWKRGFYYIAMEAKVPILIGYMDYKKKIGGIKAVFNPTGDFDKDIIEIQKYYLNFTAKHPENFNLSPQYIDKKD
ncbi:MAG: 1-acyl-sn-glycerol-3-phosphate acyltransferase [Bacteroidota bacterium]|nr:1-acyl-sn-glycerol-3-phosphate acyltransferase [Bacteroidota bacterium]